jgi:hypothetical protein
MNIHKKVIPHSKQKYDTCGDWYFTNKGLEIFISDTGNPYFNWLIGAHEEDEAMLCYFRGISQEEVTDFDIAFEAKRRKGNTDEPGNSKHAPYRKEHKFATKLEMLRAKELGVNWREYDDVVSGL